MVDKLDNKAISKKYVERADAIKNSGLCCGKLIIPKLTRTDEDIMIYGDPQKLIYVERHYSLWDIYWDEF
jgi:hypothetical protein